MAFTRLWNINTSQSLREPAYGKSNLGSVLFQPAFILLKDVVRKKRFYYLEKLNLEIEFGGASSGSFCFNADDVELEKSFG